MIVGIVLIVLSVAAAVAAVAYNGAGSLHEITAFGQHVTNANDVQIFAGGIVLGLVFCLGVWMIVAGGRRRRARNAEYRAARREARDAGRERDRLAEQLDAQEQDTTVIGRHHDREVTS